MHVHAKHGMSDNLLAALISHARRVDTLQVTTGGARTRKVPDNATRCSIALSHVLQRYEHQPAAVAAQLLFTM